MENMLREQEPSPTWQDAEEDWKATAERLQRCVSMLLLKNQQLRMALMEARRRMQEVRKGIGAPENDSP